MRLVLDYYDEATAALGEGIAIDDLVALPARERIGRFKYTPIENVDAAYEETRGPSRRRLRICTKRRISDAEGIQNHPGGRRPADARARRGGRHLQRAGRD